MNAINLDITDYLRNYNSYASHSKFCTRQILEQTACLLSQPRQSLGFLRAQIPLVCGATSKNKNFNRPSVAIERLPSLRRDDFAHLFGEIIAHDVFGRINEHLAAVADSQNQPLGVFQRRVAKCEMVNFINFLAT